MTSIKVRQLPSNKSQSTHKCLVCLPLFGVEVLLPIMLSHRSAVIVLLHLLPVSHCVPVFQLGLEPVGGSGVSYNTVNWSHIVSGKDKEKTRHDVFCTSWSDNVSESSSCLLHPLRDERKQESLKWQLLCRIFTLQFLCLVRLSFSCRTNKHMKKKRKIEFIKSIHLLTAFSEEGHRFHLQLQGASVQMLSCCFGSAERNQHILQSVVI